MNVKKTLPKIGRRTYMRCDSAEQMFATLLADFNPRTWIRCDEGLHLRPGLARAFQSTHLDKVRLSLSTEDAHAYYFNPRTWIRCDPDF